MGIIEQNVIFFRGSKKYFLATLFIPPKYRNDVMRLYNFSRMVDDLVDKQNYDIKQFDEFIVHFWRKYDNQTLTVNEVVNDFIQTARSREIPKEWIEALFSSIRKDISKPKLQRLEDTLEYTFGVAEVIGLMVCKICSISPESYEYAKYTGRAAQWANFLRDAYEDYQSGRIYLPLSEFQSEYSLPIKEEQFRYEINKQIERYKEYRELSKPGYRFLPWYLEWSVRLSAKVDDMVVSAVEHDPSISFDQDFNYRKAFIINIRKGIPL